MADIWLPGYERIDLDAANRLDWSEDANPQDTKKVMHSMEGSIESCIAVFRADPGKASHFALGMNGRKVQFIPLNRSAKSLRNLPGGVQTNRDHAIQTELEGFTNGGGLRNVAFWSDDYYKMIADHIKLCHEALKNAPGGTFQLVPTSRRWDIVDRMGQQEFDDFNGICAHRHTPENDHTDVPLDIVKLMGFIGAPTTPQFQKGNNMYDKVQLPNGSHAHVAIGVDNRVYLGLEGPKGMIWHLMQNNKTVAWAPKDDGPGAVDQCIIKLRGDGLLEINIWSSAPGHGFADTWFATDNFQNSGKWSPWSKQTVQAIAK